MADIKVSQTPVQSPSATTVLLAVQGGSIVQINLNDLATVINSGVSDDIENLATLIATNPVNLSDPGLINALNSKAPIQNASLQGATSATTPAVNAQGNELVTAAWVRQFYSSQTQTPNAPVNTVAPVVTGSTDLGATLTGTNGTWTGDATITYTYQWQRDNGAGVFSNISGATAITRVIDANDQGKTLRLGVTATNGVGNATAYSAGTLIPAATNLVFTTNPIVTANYTGLDISSTSMDKYDYTHSWSIKEGGSYTGFDGTLVGARSRMLNAIASIQALGKTPVFTTMLFSIGFEDQFQTSTGDRFQTDFAAFIPQIRADWPMATTEIVVPRVNSFSAASSTIRTAEATVASGDSLMTIVNTDSYPRSTSGGDMYDTHFTIAGLDSLGSAAYDASTVTAAANSNNAVILWVGGDNNASGAAEDAASYPATYTPSANIKILNAAGNWVTYVPGTVGSSGLIYGNDGNHIGPEIGFIRRFRADYPTATLYIVKEGNDGSYMTRGLTTGSITASADDGVLTITSGSIVNNTLLVGSGVPDGVYVPSATNLQLYYSNTSTPATGGAITSLTATTGVATPTPSSYTGQWYRGASAISGDTGLTHTKVSADEGYALNYVSTAYLSTQTASASSNTINIPAGAGSTVTQTFTSIGTTEIANPERGFYQWAGSTYIHQYSVSNLNAIKANGNTMALGLIDLSPYRTTTTIPSSFLNSLSTGFAAARTAGVKVIVRAVYNYSNSGQEATESIMTGHISQLAATLEANKDVIAYIQAGYIGPYGEWWANGSQTVLGNDTAAKARIGQAILNNTPKELMVCFRYPKDIIAWYSTPLNGSKLGDQSNQSRTASHNDCFCAGSDNGGTWQNQSQRTYMATNQKWVPNGGETCDGVGTPDYSAATAVGDGSAYGWTYMNQDYSNTFMTNWKNTTYQGETLYNYIRRKLGYRLELTQVQHPSAATQGSSMVFTATISNTGWNRVHSARKLRVILRNNSTGNVVTADGDVVRTVGPGETKTLTVVVTAPQTGSYSVFLAIPDIYPTTSGVAAHAIRFANANDSSKGQSWDSTNARFSVGTNVVIS